MAKNKRIIQKWFNRAQCAEYFGVSIKAVIRWIELGNLHEYSQGGIRGFSIPLDEMETFEKTFKANLNGKELIAVHANKELKSNYGDINIRLLKEVS